MQITVQLPDDLAQHANPGREALEALALEADIASGTLSHFETSQLLGLSRFELDGLLKQRNISDHAYDTERSRSGPRCLASASGQGQFRRMIVVADTSPLNYLIQIQLEELLRTLYQQVLSPSRRHAGTQPSCGASSCSGVASTSSVVDPIIPVDAEPDRTLQALDPGEREAIQLPSNSMPTS